MEAERTQLIMDVTANRRKMQELEANLLHKLTTIQGSLVEDVSLIQVLNITKATATDVSIIKLLTINNSIATGNDSYLFCNTARQMFVRDSKEEYIIGIDLPLLLGCKCFKWWY